MKLGLVYRGPLQSCSYRCGYCPIPKRRPSRAEASDDAGAMERFLALVESRAGDELSVLFAPRGEALVHPRYGAALRRLSHLAQVRFAAIQTNLSGDLSVLDGCQEAKIAIWATFHPGETSVAAFAGRCWDLRARAIPFSVGAVAVRSQLHAVEALRRALPEHVYLWLNRCHGAPPLTAEEAARVRAIDPWYVASPPRSRGRTCAAGSRVLVVHGDGTARRCLVLRPALGNVYSAPLEHIVAPAPRPCPANVCRCHLGYVHLEPLKFEQVFGDGMLARIPMQWPPG